MSTKQHFLILAFIGIVISTGTFAQDTEEKLVIKSKTASKEAKNLDLSIAGKSPLIVVDGVEKTKKYLDEKLSPDQIASVNVIKGEKALERFGEKGKNGVIEVTTKTAASNASDPSTNDSKSAGKDESTFILKSSADSLSRKEIRLNSGNKGPDPLIVVDGVVKSKNYLSKNIAPEQIESMNVLKGEKAIEQFGEKGKHGVILIKTKSNTSSGGSNQAYLSYPDAPHDQEMYGYKILFLIDGKVVTQAATEQINTNDIAKIDVVKDAEQIAPFANGKAYDGMVKIVMKDGNRETGKR